MAQIPFYGLNVSSGVATGRRDRNLWVLLPKAIILSAAVNLKALIFMEVIISAGFSPRLFLKHFLFEVLKQRVKPTSQSKDNN